MVDDPPPLEWEPSSLPVGVLFSTRVVETQGYLDSLAPPDPNASIRIPTWPIIMALSGIETLIQLGLVGKANFKAAKSLVTWE